MPDEAWLRSKIEADPPEWSEEKHALITEILATPGIIYVDPKQTVEQLRSLLADIRGGEFADA